MVTDWQAAVSADIAALAADMAAMQAGLAGYATTGQLASAVEPLASSVALAGVAATVPTGATSAPPPVADTSATGTGALVFALANHTHASKVRKSRVTTAADGSYTWTFSPPFDVGVVPIIAGIAETATGVTDVVNVQVEGVPTATGAAVRVTRTQRSVVALLGLTILSVPTSPGATLVHLIAVSP